MQTVLQKTFGPYTLHAHQVTAVEWMMLREEDAEMRGGLLCDEMGLGKTLSTIGLMINSPVRNTLILGPLAVISQWTRTILRTDGPAVFAVVKGAWKHLGGNIRKGRVYVTNYDKLLASPELFQMHFQRLICDEAHLMRNRGSKKYKALAAVQKDRIWLLTGTPIVNRGADLVSLLCLAHKKIDFHTSATPDRCRVWMGKYALARTMEQIRHLLADQIPKPAIVEHKRLEFSSKEEEIFYRGIQGRLVADLQRHMEQDNHMTRAFLLLLLRLRQISVHPQIYISGRKERQPDYKRDDWVGSSTKVDAVLEILRGETASRGFVIFCHFKKEIEILQTMLAGEESVGTVLAYHGEMNAEQRSAVVTESEDAMFAARRRAAEEKPKHTVLLAQIHCAGTGLNLQHMDRVIFTTPWWTAALMDQAAGRVLRLGQMEQVIIHHLGLREEEEMVINIDDYIHARVDAKRALCASLLKAANPQVGIPLTTIENESVTNAETNTTHDDPVSYD